MVVIRNGEPLKLKGSGDIEQPEEPDEPQPAERFSNAEKKCRALEKKLREIQELKTLRKSGVELDVQQQE